MAISYIFSSSFMYGTSDDDFMFGELGNQVISGGDGDDLIMADSDVAFLQIEFDEAEVNFEAPYWIKDPSAWTTSENPFFEDSSIPHASAMVEATVGQAELFKAEVGAGQTMTVDIDFGQYSPVGIGTDLVVEILDAAGNVLASSDDSMVTDGGLGSYSVDGGLVCHDPYLTFTAPSSGYYHIRVHPYGSATFLDNNTFMLNVSVTGHATTTNELQGDDFIDGGAGDDQIFGQGGNDTIYAGTGNDVIDAGSGDSNLVYGEDGDDTIYGHAGYGSNYYGNGGNDTIYTGFDGHYYGDEGNDLIYISSGFYENVDGGIGIDTLDATAINSYFVQLTGAPGMGVGSITNVENVITGGGVDTVIGSDVANVITTNGGADYISAGAGNDTIDGGLDIDDMEGGLGDDTYYVDNAEDTTVDASGAGNDKVFSSVTYSIASQFIEQLELTGVANINATGNGLNNILIGNSGNNTLNGSVGADTMQGGLGDDIYYVDNVGDLTVEASGAGTDKVFSSITYGVGSQFVEQVWLTGAANINATGNGLNNILIGNTGNNTLNGGAGVDNMQGGLGDDIYFVDNISDVVVEASGAGTDKVFSTVTYSVASQFVEQLWLTGADNVNATGNGLNNVIIGNSGNNVITGGAGVDNMQGGLGNDSYFVDSASDIVAEGGGAGTDTIYSTVSFVESVNVENLVLLGATNINATGNSLANLLKGNTGNNLLDGQAGNDTLVGVSGADTAMYQVLTGADARGGNGSDTWTDFTLGDTTINTNADKINIGSLLIGYGGGGTLAALDPYLTVNISGSNTTVLIDRDGAGATYTDTLLLTLNGINTNLLTLINNHQIVV